MAPKPSGSKLRGSISDLPFRGKRTVDDAPFSPPSSLARQLKLFVFVLGFDTSFPVIIESSETVGDLKERILEKNPNTFMGVDAANLTLYRVDFSDIKTLAQSAVRAAENDEPLLPFTPLSEIFPANPPAKTINIVVKVPSPGGWGY